MDLVYTLGGTTDVTDRVQFLEEGEGFTSAAYRGEYGACGVTVDDPAGNLDIEGWQTFTVDDMDAVPTRVWTGYIYNKNVGRFDAPPAGVARKHDCELIDLNAVFQFHVLHSNDAKRPAETDLARVDWLLSTTEGLSGLLIDAGLVTASNPINFLATDCRRRYPNSILSDLCTVSGKNYFAYLDTYSGSPALFHDRDESAVYSSPIRLSNVIADEDGTTTFFPSVDAKVIQESTERYGGVSYGWKGEPIYAQSATTIAAMGLLRDAVIDTDRVGLLATAESEAQRFLNTHAGEAQRITVTCYLPSAAVTQLDAGMRMQVKFTHLTGFETFTWTRVRRRIVKPVGADVDGTWTVLWRTYLELWVPPTDGDDATVNPCGDPVDSFAELQFQAGTGNGNASPWGPNTYEIVYRNTGDDEAAGWPDLPKYGLIDYLPVYVDGGAPLGAYFRGLTMLGTGTVTVDWFFDTSWAQSGIHVARMSVLLNGVEALYYEQATNNGFVSWQNSATGDIDVVEGDVLSALWYNETSGAEPTNPGDQFTVHFRVSGFLAPCTPEDPLPYLGDPVGPELATGTVDNSNTDFSTPGSFLPNTLRVLHDGIDQTAHVTTSDPIAGTFSLDYAPSYGSTIRVTYESA